MEIVQMQIIFSLIVAVLLYKIKLIDDRKHFNFERFKNYLRVQPISNCNLDRLDEPDTWLEKDILLQLMAIYGRLIHNQGAKHAILDYYKDYKDNEKTRKFLCWPIGLLTAYLIITANGYSLGSGLLKLIFEGLIIFLSIKVCLKQHTISLFNNPVINVENSEEAKRIYLETQGAIDKDILSYQRKYKIRRNVHIILYNDSHEVYLQERDSNAPTNPNTIGLFGGGMEENEKPKDAIIRELKEETDYDLHDSQPLDIGNVIIGGNHVVRYVYYEKYDEKSSLDCKEGKRGIWLSRDKIKIHSKIIQFDKKILEKFFSEIISSPDVSK